MEREREKKKKKKEIVKLGEQEKQVRTLEHLIYPEPKVDETESTDHRRERKTKQQARTGRAHCQRGEQQPPGFPIPRYDGQPPDSVDVHYVRSGDANCVERQPPSR